MSWLGGDWGGQTTGLVPAADPTLTGVSWLASMFSARRRFFSAFLKFFCRILLTVYSRILYDCSRGGLFTQYQANRRILLWIWTCD